MSCTKKITGKHRNKCYLKSMSAYHSVHMKYYDHKNKAEVCIIVIIKIPPFCTKCKPCVKSILPHDYWKQHAPKFPHTKSYKRHFLVLEYVVS